MRPNSSSWGKMPLFTSFVALPPSPPGSPGPHRPRPANQAASLDPHVFWFSPNSSTTLAWIDKCLDEVRPNNARPIGGSWLFIVQRGRRISRNRLAQSVKEIREAAGINKDGACPLLRHTAATLMMSLPAPVHSRTTAWEAWADHAKSKLIRSAAQADSRFAGPANRGMKSNARVKVR